MMYLNHLDRVEVHDDVDLSHRDHRLLLHNNLQQGFDRLGNDIGVCPDDE